METQVKPCKLLKVHSDLPKSVRNRVDVRHQSADDFIENHGSGTLRKNKRIGMAYRNHYLTERLAYEFGYGFEVMPSTRVNFGKAITAGDCGALTECGWHCERIMEMDIFGDKFEVKYIVVEGGMGKHAEEGVVRQGVGLVIKKTSAPFIPKGFLAFAIIAEEKSDGTWECTNPC